jgi:hypothetical protein
VSWICCFKAAVLFSYREGGDAAALPRAGRQLNPRAAGGLKRLMNVTGAKDLNVRRAPYFA